MGPMWSLIATFSLCLMPVFQAQLICEEGYTCYEDPVRSAVWVMQNAGNIGTTCQSVCTDALPNNLNIFHSCDYTQPAIYDMDSFADIATGLGFACKSGGCWDSIAPGDGLILVSKVADPVRSCYFPAQAQDISTALSCHSAPGNANCFGERYSIICPCVATALDEACVWSNPPNTPSIAKFGTDNEDNTSCIHRINYWRKRACDEQWIECPPSGLPPMTECSCCHNCANSQAEYDKKNGAHASFKRCGDMVQGEGGGSNCAAVIDAFISERKADENGTVRCQGHCGPIVARGCQTFFWGQFDGFHVLNWRTCNAEKCAAYCSNPSDNACFSSAGDIAPDTSKCENVDAYQKDDVNVGILVVFILVFVVLIGIGAFAFWKNHIAQNNQDLKTHVEKQINDKQMNGRDTNARNEVYSQ